MLAGEKVNFNNLYDKQQQSNKYVLPPKNLQSGNKLIIPFCYRKIIILEILIVITCIMVIASGASIILKICSVVLFSIELICVSYYEKKSIEIVKDEERNKLIVKLINFFGKARKTTEYDLSNVFLDVQIIKRNKDIPVYYILIIINTFKDGVKIDLDSTSIQKNPVKIFDSFEYINAYKFNGQLNMMKTLKTFVGNSSEEESPLSFSINKYMNRQEDILRQMNNFIRHVSYNKYVKLNDHFFSYYKTEPIKNKIFRGGISAILIIIHVILIQFSFISIVTLDKNMNFELIYITILSVSLLILLSTCICLNITKTGDLLRIDMIYSKNFDRLFIGLVKDDKISYMKTFCI